MTVMKGDLQIKEAKQAYKELHGYKKHVFNTNRNDTCDTWLSSVEIAIICQTMDS